MKNLLHSLKIIIWSSLLYFRLFGYVQELFPVSWKNLHAAETFSYQFFTEHYFRLSLVLNPRFNSFRCFQLLILSARPQHHLKICSL